MNETKSRYVGLDSTEQSRMLLFGYALTSIVLDKILI